MFESFRDRDPKDTGSYDELGAGAPVVPSNAIWHRQLQNHRVPFPRKERRQCQRNDREAMTPNEVGIGNSCGVKLTGFQLMQVSFGTKFIQFGYLDGYSQMFERERIHNCDKNKVEVD